MAAEQRVAPAEVRAARHRKCFLDDGRAPVTDADAALLVEQRGFLALGVLPRVWLPNLSGWDEGREWNVSWRAWRWKETLPAAKACAYLKWFYGQGTFISWRMYPFFYAIWGIRLHPEEAYDEGLLSRQEMDVLSVVAEFGPITSHDLWRKLKSRLGKRTALISALARLQKVFLVTVSGGDLEGWSMHTWDVVTSYVPDGVLDHLPRPEEAARNLVAQAVDNLVYCTTREIASLFRWTSSCVAEVARDLARTGRARLDARIEGYEDLFIASPAAQ
jgi:hypothetical protein